MEGKDFVVVFTRTNARVLVNPSNIAELLNSKAAVLNPDLALVKSIPPHFWKMDSGRIVPMTKEEQNVRLSIIASAGVDNTIITEEVINKDPAPDLFSENKKLKELNVLNQSEIVQLKENLNITNDLNADYVKQIKFLENKGKNLWILSIGLGLSLIISLIL